MTTEQIILIALAVNFVVAVAAIAIPRIRNRRAAAASSDASPSGRTVTGAPAADSAGARPSVAAGRTPLPHASDASHASQPADAGAPWFPARNGQTERSLSGVRAISTDPVTGFDLPPAWSRWLAEEEARVRRFHHPATIVLVELSGLDRLADRLGDEAAQRLIPPIALTMRKNARATDHLARLAPARFGAILVETDEVRAINYIERVRSACDVWLEAGAVMLRLSVGWAEMSPDRPAEIALVDAERRLYEERERTWTLLARQGEERDVEAAVLTPA
jgi:diguanylate cyclase (GGDEF)-like protein